MSPVFAVIAVAALGIDVGWQPLDEGGVEYIIQIEPDQVDRMKNFDDLISDVPKDLDVRRYRITIGNEKLPRLTEKATTPTKATETPAAESTAVEKATGREVIAEGSIPPIKKATTRDETATGPVLVDPTPEEAATDEGAAEETVAKKPVTGTFAADPEPKDEEDGDLAPLPASRVSSQPRADDLFEPAPSRPLKSRLLEEPQEEPAPRSPMRNNRIVSEQPEDDYQTEKPSLPDSFRTAQNTSRPATADFDRETSGNDGAWGSIVAIFFFLLLSMGANMWLGWIAWEARQRYQILLEKYRAAGGKGSVELA